MEPLSINKKIPISGILIHVREAYIHCAKAVLRSKLWDEDSRQDRQRFAPTSMFADHVNRDYDEYNASYEDDMQLSMIEEGRE